MHLSSRTTLALIALALVACGPEVHDKPDWMLGTFSDPGPGNRSLGLDAITHYEFRDDGEFVVGGVHDCATNAKLDERQLVWVREGNDVVRVDHPEPGQDVESWRISNQEKCASVTVERIRGDGVVLDTGTWYRGEVCLHRLPPCPVGTECDGCESVWCEGESPECE